MLFPTLSFAAFFAVVLPVSWLLMPKRVRWRLFMVGASWFFYGAADWRFVPLLAGSTVVNHYFARRIQRATGRTRHTWTVAAVATNLVVLAWFKYIGFLSLSAQSSLRFFGIHAHVPLPEVLLPIGISFFTFQALSYVIDVSRGKVRPVSLLEFAVYLSFFPHLIAGPIVRASEFLPQIREKIGPRNVDVGKAFWLISLGLFKKVVISSYLGTYAADPLFGFPRQHAGIEALFGVYAYAIQIYMDFSGYTDIAIGLALLLGIKFPQNFNAPYAAASLQDFWRRWHMTLSRWLRDYLYIPLGGNRRGRIRTYVNVMITMLLGGLWHGAAWTFVAWGALHGVGLGVERWRGERHRAPIGAVPADDGGDLGKREAAVASRLEPPVPPPLPVGPPLRRPKVATAPRDEVAATSPVASVPNGSGRTSDEATATPRLVNGLQRAHSEASDSIEAPEAADSVMSGGALWDAVVSGRILSRWRTPRGGSTPDAPERDPDPDRSAPVPVGNGGALTPVSSPSATSSEFDKDRSVWASSVTTASSGSVTASVAITGKPPVNLDSGPPPAGTSTPGTRPAPIQPASSVTSPAPPGARSRTAPGGAVPPVSGGRGAPDGAVPPAVASGPGAPGGDASNGAAPVVASDASTPRGAAPPVAASGPAAHDGAAPAGHDSGPGGAVLTGDDSGPAVSNPGDSGPSAAGPGRTGSRGRALAWPAWSPRSRLWVGRVITFHVVCLAWIFFRATSFHNAMEVLGRIAALGGHHRPFNWKVAAVILGALAVQVGPRGVGTTLQAFFSRRAFWVQALILAGVLTLIDLLGPAGVAPFIYFRF